MFIGVNLKIWPKKYVTGEPSTTSETISTIGIISAHFLHQNLRGYQTYFSPLLSLFLVELIPIDQLLLQLEFAFSLPQFEYYDRWWYMISDSIVGFDKPLFRSIFPPHRWLQTDAVHTTATLLQSYWRNTTIWSLRACYRERHRPGHRWRASAGRWVLRPWPSAYWQTVRPPRAPSARRGPLRYERASFKTVPWVKMRKIRVFFALFVLVGLDSHFLRLTVIPLRHTKEGEKIISSINHQLRKRTSEFCKLLKANIVREKPNFR